eukprot:1157935-Pelagomonas_calceolata.AAC.9
MSHRAVHTPGEELTWRLPVGMEQAYCDSPLSTFPVEPPAVGIPGSEGPRGRSSAPLQKGLPS